MERRIFLVATLHPVFFSLSFCHCINRKKGYQLCYILCETSVQCKYLQISSFDLPLTLGKCDLGSYLFKASLKTSQYYANETKITTYRGIDSAVIFTGFLYSVLSFGGIWKREELIAGTAGCYKLQPNGQLEEGDCRNLLKELTLNLKSHSSQFLLPVTDQAFVTLATDDVYCQGALVLGQSLRNHTTSRKLAVLITPEVSSGMR